MEEKPKAPKVRRDYVADHARRTLRAAGLTKEEAADAVNTIVKNGRLLNTTYIQSLSDISRKLPHPGYGSLQTALERFIRTTFSWSASRLGWDYWNDRADAIHAAR